MPPEQDVYKRQADMNGAKVTVYVTNCGNGTADIQAIMKGTSGTSYANWRPPGDFSLPMHQTRICGICWTVDSQV